MKVTGLWPVCAMWISSLCHAAAPTTAIAPAQACSLSAGLRTTESDLKLDRAESIPAAAPGTVRWGPAGIPVPVAVPAHCRVEGIIGQRTGSAGKKYGLTFALALPDAWNGRFLFQGGGGLNGTLFPPLGADAAGDSPALARGFAVVSTDGGHRGAVFDDSFTTDQQASLDFAFNAVPTVTAVAKQLINAYYGKPAAHSYFNGCSTGGREGMQAAERYPFLFDGVITGAPAMRTGHSNIALKWAAVAFNQAAPKDPVTGQPIAGGAFSPEQRHLIVERLLQACDALDGLRDGLIFNVRGCHFDPAVLACNKGNGSSCLQPAQVAALQRAFGGPVTLSGRRVYTPHPYDTGIAAQGPVIIPGFLLTSTGGPVSGKELPTSIDLEREEAAVQDNGFQQLIDTDRWTNLGTFAARGGKQIFYHGVSDPWFSAMDTIDYYERLRGAGEPPAQAHEFARLFLVPGMGHCRGGDATLDRFDLLSPLVEWVEEGKAPESVIATGSSLPGMSRPLCAWPLHAHYKGKGDTRSAASFECKPSGDSLE
jgi:hypothetical protein